MRHALLLAGGQGKRFWPRSRRQRPKQFMPFAGGPSLLRTTAERLVPVVPFERQWVITHRDYVDRVREELPEIPNDQVVGEPRGLNTGPAVGLGAALMQARDPEAVMIVQAADHWIRDVKRFRQLARAAFGRVERDGRVVLIGFPPTRPATGYGYISLGDAVDGPAGMRMHAVAGYKEKPAAATARRYLASGQYLWNGCMFFWEVARILDEIGRHVPALGAGLGRARRRLAAGEDVDAVVEGLYRRTRAISIEHGVVEHLRDTVALVGDCGWEDVGTWESLARLLPADELGNVAEGDHLAIDTRDTVVLSDAGLVVTLGVKDLIIIRDGDAVLVLPRSREGDVRQAIEQIAEVKRLRRYL